MLKTGEKQRDIDKKDPRKHTEITIVQATYAIHSLMKEKVY